MSLSIDARVAAAVSAMTLDEKLQQMQTNTPKGIGAAIPRLDWPAFPYHSEGLHGLRNSYDTMGLYATVFPQVTGMAATGNMSLIYAMARVMADEARALNNAAMAQGKMFTKGAGLFYWSPTMNLGRDPRWGRFQESISEDPFLNGAYSTQFVKAMKGNDSHYLQTAPTCKHAAGYSVEGYGNATRHNFNAIISQQDLLESYLPAFKRCVTEAQPPQIMCSYNAINGVPSCADSQLLNTTIRNSWGYTGFIVSDEGAINDIFNGHAYVANGTAAVAAAVNAGCDQNDGVVYGQYLSSAVQDKLLTQDTVDRALSRVLHARFRVGAFDPPTRVPWTNLTQDVLASSAHRALALDAAQQSIVLLKNAGAVLPLQASKLKKIAVIGPAANNSQILSGGKTDYAPVHWTTHLEGISTLVHTQSPQTKILFAEGCDVTCANTAGFADAVAAAAAADITLAFVGIDSTIEHEGADRTTIGLVGQQEALLAALGKHSHGPLVVVLVHGGPLSSSWAKANADAVVDAVDGGEAAGTALADVLFGQISPSGMLPYSIFPESYAQENDFLNMSMRAAPGRTYRFYTGTPLWPFGFGLHYSTFAYSWATAPPTVLTIAANASDSAPVFCVRITNTGSRSSAVPVQVYLQEVTPRAVLHGFDAAAAMDTAPHKTLVALEKVALQPGESSTVTVTLPTVPLSHASWCSFCTVSASGRRVVAPGKYRVHVGGHGGAEDGPLIAEIVLEGALTDVPL